MHLWTDQDIRLTTYQILIETGLQLVLKAKTVKQIKIKKKIFFNDK